MSERGVVVLKSPAEAMPLGVLERLGVSRDGPETALVRWLRLLAGCGF